VKAQDIVVFNTEHLSSMFERVIVASGTSNRQTKALAASVRDAVKGRGMPVLSTEGEDNGEWIIVDCGAAVAHIMQPAVREYYHLEEIWGGKAVKLKTAVLPRGLPKASEPEAAVPVAKKAAAKKPLARKTAGKTASKKVATKPAPAKKAPAKKAPAKKAPARMPAAKSPAAKKRSTAR
jgi:ribosome-associated protein